MTNDYYAQRPVVVVGGLGFIGSHLVIELVRRGAQVTIIDSLNQRGAGRLHNIRSVEKSVRIHIQDIRDEVSTSPIIRGQSVIFALSGQVSHIDSMQAPLEDLELNARAQLCLLESCRQTNTRARLVFASTRQVYGRCQYLPVDELHPLQPSDINGVHKLAAENYYRLYSHNYGMPTAILRMTNTYGPHMDLHPLKGFVGVFIDHALKGKLIRLFGGGSQKRDFNYVSDVVDALLLVGQHMTAGHQVYNLGHHDPISLRGFVELLNHYLPVNFQSEPFPEKAERIDIGDYYGSYQRLHEATGWRPKVALQEGLRLTLDYFLQGRKQL